MNRDDFQEYDKDFANEIFPYLVSGKLQILDEKSEKKYSNLLVENYPYRLGRIQFKQTDLILSKSDFGDITEQTWKALVEKKLEYITLKYKLTDLEFVLFGDNLIQNSYCFIFKDFFEYFWTFFSIPQHTYLLSKSGTYLLSYTFEDDIYFIRHERPL